MEASFPPEPRPLTKRMVATTVVAAAALSVVILGVSALLKPKPIVSPATVAVASRPVVTITDAGFSPTSIKVVAGTTVRWVNKTTKPHSVGSNPYPEHSDLPELYANTPIAPNATYDYTFAKAGTWGYDDPTNPTAGGTVVVQ